MASPRRLLSFFVHGVLAAVPAELLQFKLVFDVRVLIGKIINALAFTALKLGPILGSRHSKVIRLLVEKFISTLEIFQIIPNKLIN